jgi:RNA polymerase sigma-70 factor, ECF subfamily
MDELDPITEAALRARRGDTVSAAAFVRATQADVWRLCAHLSARDGADDLTQETYARAFASLHRFAGRSSPGRGCSRSPAGYAPTRCAQPCGPDR